MARARANNRRLLDLIENPDEKTTQAILDMNEEGLAMKEIARRTALTTRTIRRVLRKHEVEPRGRLTDEQAARIRELSKVPGVTVGAMARDVGLDESTIRKFLKRADIELGLSVTVAARLEEKIEEQEQEEEEEPITRELRLEIAKDVVEFKWAIAASKMLLLPAQVLPHEERLRRLQSELSEGERAIRTAGGKKRGAMAGKVIIDGRDMIGELRDVAAYVLKMIQGETPEEYQKRYKRGGVEAVLKHGKKVVASQPTPVEAQAVADFISLAAAHAAVPGAERAVGFTKLAEEHEEAELAVARAGEARAEREWREEAKIVAGLKRVSHDPEKFMERLEQVRAQVDHLPGPVRTIAKRRLKKLAKEVVPPKLWEDVWKLKEWNRIQKLREQARMLYEGKGHKATEKEIDAVLIQMGETEPRPGKPRPPRRAEAPASWTAWMARMQETAPGTRLPPEAYAAPEEPHILARPIRVKPPRKKKPKKVKPKTKAQIAREEKKAAREKLKAAKARIAAGKAAKEQRERIEAAIFAVETKLRPLPGKPKKKAPKLEGGLQATVYALLLAKATPEEVREITGFALGAVEEKEIRKRLRGRVSKGFQKAAKEQLATLRRQKAERLRREVASLVLAGATAEEVVGMTGVEVANLERVVADYSAELKGASHEEVTRATGRRKQAEKRLELYRSLREEVRLRALAQAAELERRAKRNPGRTTWGDRLFYRVNAALALGTPMKRKRRAPGRRAATRRNNPNRSDALRRMMRL